MPFVFFLTVLQWGLSKTQGVWDFITQKGRDRHNCSVFRGTLLFRVPVPRNRDGTEQNFKSSAERGTGTEQNFGISAERGTGTEHVEKILPIPGKDRKPCTAGQPSLYT